MEANTLIHFKCTLSSCKHFSLFPNQTSACMSWPKKKKKKIYISKKNVITNEPRSPSGFISSEPQALFHQPWGFTCYCPGFVSNSHHQMINLLRCETSAALPLTFFYPVSHHGPFPSCCCLDSGPWALGLESAPGKSRVSLSRGSLWEMPSSIALRRSERP